MYDVRPMVTDDIDAVVGLVRDNHSQCRYAGLSFNEDGTRLYAELALSNDYTQAYSLVKDDKVVGCIAAMVGNLPWTYDLIANEIFFTIHPEHRGYKQAMMLLRAYVGWAKQVGAKLINVSADNCDGSDERTMVLYQRAGFSLSGRTLSMKGE